MRLEKILNNTNSLEKNSFLKIIDLLISKKPTNAKAIEEILVSSSKDLKSIDSQNIVSIFHLLENEFNEYLKCEFLKTSSQLDILIDIISRDGCCIIKQDWFSRLYDKELKSLKSKLKKFEEEIENEKSEITEERKRDYRVYLSCLKTAYFNDESNNQDKKITSDEHSILLTLSKELSLSQEEIKLINYLILPVKKLEVDTIINDLKSIGVIFYSKKNNIIYVPDEMVRLLRKIRGKDVGDKFFRRVLLFFKEPQINLIARKHNIDRKLSNDEKINEIINAGITLKQIFIEDIHKEGTNLTDKKKFLNDFCEKNFSINILKGSLLEEKLDSLVMYFEDIEKDDKIGMSHDGFEKMLIHIGENIPMLNQILKAKFELQDENVLRGDFLLDYNIKPRDILELIPDNELLEFCKIREIKSRGDIISNVLDAYKDSENLFLENYENIGFRNLLALKEGGISIKEVDLGVKFEELTKKIFTELGFHIDEKLRKSLNTSKEQIDILINLGNDDLIIVECKTVKESNYNKFSAVSRQLKAYDTIAKRNNCRVIKSLLIAPEFSDDFIKDCGLEYELNLSLITASSLIKILIGFRKSKLKIFPHNLLMRDVLIQEDRVLKAIGK
ncbi:hypothetical protein J2X31_001719 [Flavobacterium arsenatis]|uniref:Restriction endonuclease type IV Mrr domain-containing protein n=1 Tax=Flavobacterium arsenatis TaxID=1484332 RepID=A0ABU1TPG8_9FLAO|nr:hypothetical protein [Flavobacterium arsenatis]MDR6967707.1 hypothetical protein [Flavobacterium arsenatis]